MGAEKKNRPGKPKAGRGKSDKPTFIEKARKKQILEVAFELFLEYGYDNTSVEDIADRAEVSRGVIFYYFKYKSDIGQGVVRKGLREYSIYVQERIAGKRTARTKIFEFVAACIDYTREHRSDYLVYLDTMGRFASSEGKLDFLQRMNDETRSILVKLIKEGQAEGNITKIHAQNLADVIQGSVDGLMGLAAVQPDKVNLDGCKKILINMIKKLIDPDS